MITVRLLPPLTRILRVKEILVEGAGGPLLEVLANVAAERAALKEFLFDGTGSLSLEFSCMVNSEHCPRSELSTRQVKDGDEITLMMPISGG